MLLDIDGLSQYWGSESEAEESSFATSRLNNPSSIRTLDLSSMGLGSDCVRSTSPVECDDGNIVTPNADGSINVVDLSLDEFRSRLVNHFNIAFQRKEIKWPKRKRAYDDI